MYRPLRFISLFALMALFAASCVPVITGFSNTCSSVTINYNIEELDPSEFPIPDLDDLDELGLSDEEIELILSLLGNNYQFEVIMASDGTTVGRGSGPSVPVGSHTVTIPLDQTYPEGTEFIAVILYYVSVTLDDESVEEVLVVDYIELGGCDMPIELTWQDDGRLNWFHGFGDRIVLYTVGYGANGIGLHIYNVEDDSEGRLLLQITPDMINGTPPGPENTLILETRDIYNVLVSVYRLSTGELQINYGPDHEGKVFVYILDPSTLNVLDNYHTFNVYDILGN